MNKKIERADTEGDVQPGSAGSASTSTDRTPGAHPDNEARETDQSGIQEIGGRKGPEPTRYGDWEKDGRCIDF